MKRAQINLTPRECEIITAALDTYLSEQLPGEDATPRQIVFVEKLAERFPRGTGRYTAREIHEMAQACEAHLYWEVSDPRDRNDGFVFWNPDEDGHNGKMARDDRDPAYVEACREVDTLRERLEGLAQS